MDRVVRVGLLTSGTAPRWTLVQALVESALREHGYVEGKNLVFHRRAATWPDERMDQFAAELAGSTDAIITTCGWTTMAAVKATPKVPIVMGGVGEKVVLRVAKSLARPGGNVTGQMNVITHLTPKMLEMLLAALPETKVVGALINPRSAGHLERIRELEAAAKGRGTSLVRIDLRSLSGDTAARALFRESAAHALLVLPDDDLIWEYVDRVLKIADEMRLPTLFPRREVVDIGGLMSFGSDPSEIFSGAVRQVDRIINGGDPAEMPIERPTRYDLAINVRKAAAFGITIPRAVLLRADYVR